MFRITVNDSGLQAAFARLRRAVDDQKPAFEDIGSYMLKRVDDGFRNEVSPYGLPWAALSPKTIKNKGKKRQILKVLQSTGLLRGSFSYTADRDSVEIGTNRVSANGSPIGLFHQIGAGRLPKREMLPSVERGLPPIDQEEILAILGDHIEGAW